MNVTVVIKYIYPDIISIKEKSMDWLCERAILTPKVDAINETVLESFYGTEMKYKLIDSVIDTDDAVQYTVEFLNSLSPPVEAPVSNFTVKSKSTKTM